MEDIINIYNSILINKFKYIMDNSIIKKIDEENCKLCKEKFNELFLYEKNIKFSKFEFHQLIIHNQINYYLYEKICKLKGIKLEKSNFSSTSFLPSSSSSSSCLLSRSGDTL